MQDANLDRAGLIGPVPGAGAALAAAEGEAIG